MAKPKIDLVVWASQDYILPNAHGINKVKPIDDLLKKGYDKGEAPAAEEFNYLLNMCTDYVRWVYEERLPEFEQEIIDLLNKFKTEILAELDKLRREMAQLEERVKAEIEALKQYLVPVGAVIQWHSVTPPAGWLECNGQGFDPSTYPKLYAALDNKANVPDYRGYFPRGWAHGSAVDPDSGRQLGSIQGDAIRNITGSIHGSGAVEEGATYNGAFYNNGLFRGADGGRDADYGIGFDASRVVPTASENRPKNIAVMYIIKTDTADASGAITPTGIITSPERIEQLVGHTSHITAQVMPINLAAQWPITYASLDTSVATVDTSGNVTLVGQGDTKIIASIANGMMSQVGITSHTGLVSLTLSSSGTVVEGTSESVVVTMNPTDSNEPLDWESSNTGVLVVNSVGSVTGVSVGSATVTARGRFTGKSGSVNITVSAKPTPAPVVSDVKLGAEYTKGYGASNPVKANEGSVLTGLTEWAGDNEIHYYFFKPIQVLKNGVWVTITG